MFYANTVRFNVMKNFEKFFVFLGNKALSRCVSLSPHRTTQKARPCQCSRVMFRPCLDQKVFEF